VAPIALAFGVLDLTHSETDLGIVLAANWVPQLVLILLGGVFADRLPRHLVMVGSNAISALAQGTIAYLLLTGKAELWQLIALQVVRGAAFSFFFPASAGLVPQTVSPARLQQANVLLGISRNATSIVGAGLGGALVQVSSPGWALAFDSATYLASAAILAAMHIPLQAARAAAPNLVHELRDGWSEFVSRRWLWTIVVAAGFGNMAATGATGVYGPLVAKDFLGGAAAWGVITACEGVGLLIGGLILLRYRPQRPLFVGVAALLVWSLPILCLAGLRTTAVIAAGYLLAGIALELFNTAWAVALQQHVPLEKLSRVSAYDALGSFVFIPAGLTLAGPIAQAVGLRDALLLAAGVVILTNLAVLSVREVRELRRVD
jgi:predicted MFS family arabinose efflux permease